MARKPRKKTKKVKQDTNFIDSIYELMEETHLDVSLSGQKIKDGIQVEITDEIVEIAAKTASNTLLVAENANINAFHLILNTLPLPQPINSDNLYIYFHSPQGNMDLGVHLVKMNTDHESNDPWTEVTEEYFAFIHSRIAGDPADMFHVVVVLGFLGGNLTHVAKADLSDFLLTLFVEDEGKKDQPDKGLGSVFTTIDPKEENDDNFVLVVPIVTILTACRLLREGYLMVEGDGNLLRLVGTSKATPPVPEITERYSSIHMRTDDILSSLRHWAASDYCPSPFLSTFWQQFCDRAEKASWNEVVDVMFVADQVYTYFDSFKPYQFFPQEKFEDPVSIDQFLYNIFISRSMFWQLGTYLKEALRFTDISFAGAIFVFFLIRSDLSEWKDDREHLFPAPSDESFLENVCKLMEESNVDMQLAGRMIKDAAHIHVEAGDIELINKTTDDLIEAANVADTSPFHLLLNILPFPSPVQSDSVFVYFPVDAGMKDSITMGVHLVKINAANEANNPGSVVTEEYLAFILTGVSNGEPGYLPYVIYLGILGGNLVLAKKAALDDYFPTRATKDDQPDTTPDSGPGSVFSSIDLNDTNDFFFFKYLAIVFTGLRLAKEGYLKITGEFPDLSLVRTIERKNPPQQTIAELYSRVTIERVDIVSSIRSWSQSAACPDPLISSFFQEFCEEAEKTWDEHVNVMFVADKVWELFEKYKPYQHFPNSEFKNPTSIDQYLYNMFYGKTMYFQMGVFLREALRFKDLNFAGAIFVFLLIESDISLFGDKRH